MMNKKQILKNDININVLNDTLDDFFESKSSGACLGDVGFCVMQNGNKLYQRYFGNVGDKTLFRIASMTKPITAVAVLIQVSRRLLDLDEPICKLLPEFAAEPSKRLITPGMLLTHTSGVGTDDAFTKAYAKMLPSDKQNLEQVTCYVAKQELSFVPNTRQSYSPLWGFDILARLVEISSGMAFHTFLKDNIFIPCGMKDTTFTPTQGQWSNMVYMHDIKQENGAFKNTVGKTTDECVFADIPTTWHCGGAGLASTLPDYVKFAQMLLGGGVAESGERILPQEYVEKMVAVNSKVTAISEVAHWGLGVRVITADKHHLPKGSFGWSGAYGSHFWIDTENKITAVLMRNSRYDGGSGSSISAELEKCVYLSCGKE